MRSGDTVPDIKIQGRGLSDDSDLNIVYGLICFGSRRFLDVVIQKELRHLFSFGRLLNETGLECPGVRTYTCKNVVTVRGGERSTFRVCNECGRILYSAIGKKYVLKSEIKDALVAEDQSGSLITAVNTGSILQMSWKNVSIRGMPLKDEPVDRLHVPLVQS